MNSNTEDLKKRVNEQNIIIESLKEDYDSLFEHSQVGIVCLNKDGEFININRKFCDILEYSKEELLGLKFSNITYKDDKNKSINLYSKNQSNQEKSYVLEKRYIKKDGKIVWAEIFINHIFDENGNFLYTLGFVTDISKRKGIQDTLLEQTKTMQLYLDIVDVAIIVVNKQGNITLVNRKSSEILGYDEHLILGKNLFRNFVCEEDRDCLIKDFITAIEQKTDISEKIQYSVICKDGKKRTILWRRRYIYDENRTINGMISSGEDITELLKLEKERKRNQQILFQQTKLASMGEMLRNIAHQWRQPLSTISTAASGMKVQKEMNILSDEDFEIGMTAIVKMTQYLSQTINEFQSFFKIDNVIKEFTIEELFSKIENFVYTSFKSSNITFIVRNRENFHIKGPFNEMIQIIINILNNSKDAFSEKDIKNKAVFLDSFLGDEEFIISIKDNAGGIEEGILNKIFEPYFTTKHQSLGTGIGLFMVRDVVENRLKGKIEVYNENISHKGDIRKGAVFKIIVPRDL